MDIEIIKNKLEKIPVEHEEKLKELFWEELNYNQQNIPLSTAELKEGSKNLLVEAPILFASAGENDGFHILLFHLNSEKLKTGEERQLINEFIQTHPFSLFIFANQTKDHWHFVNVKYEEHAMAAQRRVIRRISISPEERLRTASERIAMLDVQKVQLELLPSLPSAIQSAHEEAFNVEKVTKDFFDNYKKIFKGLEKDLFDKSKDEVWAHDFALLFLNRLMFIYYIQRKRWLGNDPDFLHEYWRAYTLAHRSEDSFKSEWLDLLFFQAFNNQFAAGRADVNYLPEKFREALQQAPYLNGGLFTKKELDRKYLYVISDAQIGVIFEFLDKYNFTISEDTPLDQEVAVDPEMIGKVYESLVNVSAEASEQAEAGIFYTPRVEIDLMCRLSLVDWLVNHLGKEHRNLLYEMVFAFNPEDKAAADEEVNSYGLWQKLNQLLRQITVLDPACGSGSFLIGMLLILDDLNIRAEQYLGIKETAYARRKRIIGENLYGVDVMGWAVEVAELRLWLQLAIETELSGFELRAQTLLPNLSLKIRQGDSLVQEIGGIRLSLQERGGGNLPTTIKNRLNQLKQEKMHFFQNEPGAKYRSEEQIRQDEFLLFHNLLQEELQHLKNRIKDKQEQLAPKKNLLGEILNPQIDIEHLRLEQEVEELVIKKNQTEYALNALEREKQVPFVWDLAFVEIFEGEKGGFDIVVGNPPYVRQEKIRDPNLPINEITKENKARYKKQLQKSVYFAWPLTFGWRPGSDQVSWKLGGRADYFIYFYFDCLKLLNRMGSFCFITSNSWLDVAYGSDLQRFLLTRGWVKLILDNQVKRSFASADINTVIVLLSAAKDAREDIASNLQHEAIFVMFKVPFEFALSPVVWEEVLYAKDITSTQEYRCVMKTHDELLINGFDAESSKYIGDKWGGKYLRAPDIYWVIMEKAKDKLVRLGDVADVRFGIKTGANEFFYLDEEKIKQWGIEEEFLKPVIKSPRECRSILIHPKNLKNKIFFCNKSRDDLDGTSALEYIKWGESKGFHNRPTCKNRRLWWDFRVHREADVIWFKSFNDKYLYPINSNNFLVSDRIYEVFMNHDNPLNSLILAFNNPFVFLSTEINGRVNLGEGALDNMTYEARENYIINPQIINKDIKIIEREIYPINNELLQEDRMKIDNELFKTISLTKNEIDCLYEELINLTSKRLKKAINL